MHRRIYSRVLALFCFIGIGAAGCVHPIFLSPDLRPYFFSKQDAASGLRTIRSDTLRSHITYLASGELEGRETSYSGQQMAADYLASYFRYLGLEPLNPEEGHIQSVPLQRVFPAPSQTVQVLTELDTVSLTYKEDYLLSSRGVYSAMELDAQVVFVGYGLDLESWDYDEYDTLNVARKWVLIIDGKPRVPDTANPQKKQAFARTSRRLYKYLVAKNAGAAGVLMAPDTRDSQGTQTSPASSSHWNALCEIISHPHITAPEEKQTNSIPLLYLNQETADFLLQSINSSLLKSQRTIDSTRSPISQKLPLSFRAQISVESKPVQGQNIIGIYHGRDSVLAEEHILIAAHYDHLGIRADSIIYHGADDNASGTAAVLSLARAFTSNTTRPRRSLIFALFDAEEHGLYGSKHFSEHPPVPLENITAALNLDMIGRNNPDSIYVIGSDMHSQDLHNLSLIADAHVPLLSTNDRYNSVDHSTRIYYRSDHYSFARHEIPVIGYFDGFHPDYHQPTDIPEKLQYRKIQWVTKLAYLTAWGAANYPDTLRLDGTLMK